MHQPTERVLRVLNLITESGGGKRLVDFSRELGIPKSTLLPILLTLCQRRYLYQDDVGRYYADAALFSLGAAFSGCFPVLGYIHGELEKLVQSLEETCYFGVLEDGMVLYLEKVESPQPLRMLTAAGRKLPAYATSLGKMLLAGKTEEELRALYPQGLAPLTEYTVTDFGVLAQQTAQALVNGYGWELEESTRHIRCFAVPVYKRGKIIAAISVAIPLFRYEQGQDEKILQTLRAAADQISRTIEDTDAHFGDVF